MDGEPFELRDRCDQILDLSIELMRHGCIGADQLLVLLERIIDDDKEGTKAVHLGEGSENNKRRGSYEDDGEFWRPMGYHDDESQRKHVDLDEEAAAAAASSIHGVVVEHSQPVSSSHQDFDFPAFSGGGAPPLPSIYEGGHGSTLDLRTAAAAASRSFVSQHQHHQHCYYHDNDGPREEEDYAAGFGLGVDELRRAAPFFSNDGGSPDALMLQRSEAILVALRLLLMGVGVSLDCAASNQSDARAMRDFEYGGNAAVGGGLCGLGGFAAARTALVLERAKHLAGGSSGAAAAAAAACWDLVLGGGGGCEWYDGCFDEDEEARRYLEIARLEEEDVKCVARRAEEEEKRGHLRELIEIDEDVECAAKEEEHDLNSGRSSRSSSSRRSSSRRSSRRSRKGPVSLTGSKRAKNSEALELDVPTARSLLSQSAVATPPTVTPVVPLLDDGAATATATATTPAARKAVLSAAARRSRRERAKKLPLQLWTNLSTGLSASLLGGDSAVVSSLGASQDHTFHRHQHSTLGALAASSFFGEGLQGASTLPSPSGELESCGNGLLNPVGRLLARVLAHSAVVLANASGERSPSEKGAPK